MNLITFLPSCLSCGIFNEWIELKDVARMDSAFCAQDARPTFLSLLMSKECIVGSKTNSPSCIFVAWLLKRAVKVRYFCISVHLDDALGIQYMQTFGSLVTRIVHEARFYSQFKTPGSGIEIIRQAFSYGHLVFLRCYDISVQFLK